jgi:ribosomal protein L40E
MWMCSKCHETLEDAFEACWKCGTSKDGEPDAAFEPAVVKALTCLRCEATLEHVGTKRFHEGARWGALGELGELFVKRDRFDVYACPQCGHVEFFLDGVGEEHRPPEAE